MDTEGAIESVCINRVSILSGLNLQIMSGLSPETKQAVCNDEVSVSVLSGLSKVDGLLAKIAAYLVSIGRLFFLAFLYGWCFSNKIPLEWPLTLTTQTSTLNKTF